MEHLLTPPNSTIPVTRGHLMREDRYDTATCAAFVALYSDGHKEIEWFDFDAVAEVEAARKSGDIAEYPYSPIATAKLTEKDIEQIAGSRCW